MIDHQMFDILQNLEASTNSSKTTLTESSKDLTKDSALHDNNQETMRDLLNIINEGVSPAGPKLKQMPGNHVMAKGSKDGHHPAHEFLVGGKDASLPDDAEEEQLDEMEPLEHDRKSARQMEKDRRYTKSNHSDRQSQSDFANDMLKRLRKSSMDEDVVDKKQSLAEILKSSEESNEDRVKRLAKELYTKISNVDLSDLEKDDNGKYRLNDNENYEELDEAAFDNELELKNEIKHLTHLLHGGIGDDVKHEVLSKLKELKYQLAAMHHKELSDPYRPYEPQQPKPGILDLSNGEI